MTSFLVEIAMMVCYNGIMRKRIVLISQIFLLILFLTSPLLSSNILDDVIEKVVETNKSGKLPAVIFDLDGTLFYTGLRSKQIFLEFAETQGDSALKMKVEAINAYMMKYKVRESLTEAGIDDSTLLKEMLDAWRMKFFNGAYLKYDEPIPGAVKFVNKLYNSGALIIYLTGRNASGMLEGTVASLQNNCFPIGVERTELIMKPERFMKTFTYKKKTLKYIKKLGPIIAVFENEPRNINLLYETFPNVTAIFLKTSHKPHAPSLKHGIQSIKDYQR